MLLRKWVDIRHGLEFVLLRPSLRQLWILLVKRTNLTLGKYPDLSLAKARSKALEARELLAEQIDPKEHKDEQLKAVNKKKI